MNDKSSTEMTLRFLIKAVLQEHGENVSHDKMIRSLRDRIGFESAIIPLLGMIRIRSIVFEELSSNPRITEREGEGR